MPIRVSESELQRLARMNRRVVRQLGRNFVGRIDLESPGGGLLSFDSDKLLNELEIKSRRWANRNISRIYKASKRNTERQLRSLKRFVPDPSLDKRFSSIHKSSVKSLIDGPVTGFMSGVGRASSEVRGRVRLIRSQLGSLSDQQRVIQESVARVGLLGKGNLNSVRDGLVAELIGAGKVSGQVFRNKFKMLGAQNIFSNIANISFVTFPNGKGGVRHIRLDDYVETLGRAKSSQAVTTATRNTLLRHGHELVQVSRVKSRDGDFCDVYAGKVFALTKEASMRWGVPHVAQLPNGGAPFHPNCRHREIPYFPNAVNRRTRRRDMAPPPAWALDAPMGQVQSIYAGTRKKPEARAPKFKPLGTTVANWDSRVLERMAGEPVGRAAPENRTFVGSVKRGLAKRGVRKISDLILLGGFLDDEIRGTFLGRLERSDKHINDFKKSVRSVFTQYKNRRSGQFFPDTRASDFLALAIESFDSYQDTMKGLDEPTQEKTVSTVAKIRSMGVGSAGEARQNWTDDTPVALKRDFNKTLSYFPTSWLLKSKKGGLLEVAEKSKSEDFGYSYYHKVADKKALFSVAALHARLPNVARVGIFLYLMSLRIKESLPELQAFERDFWYSLGPREKEEVLSILGHPPTGVKPTFVPEIFASGVLSIFGYDMDGLTKKKITSFVLGAYAGIP